MLNTSTAFRTTWVKPDRAARLAKRAQRQQAASMLAALSMTRKTAVARLVKPVERQPIVSDTVEWCAFPLSVHVGIDGAARCDWFHRGGMVASQPMYARPTFPIHADIVEDDCAHWETPERWADEVILSFQSPDPVTFTPNTAPLVAARERKEAELLLKISPANDCLHVEPSIVVKAAPCPEPRPNGHKPAPVAEHILEPIILIDGVPETVEAQARRIASMSITHGTDQSKRTVFYDGREKATAAV